MSRVSWIKPNEYICMTASKSGATCTVRVERAACPDLHAAYHVADGPFRGIVINKSRKALPPVEPPTRAMTFTTSMEGRRGLRFKEQRDVRFWVRGEEGGEGQHSTEEFFKLLLKPDVFPKANKNKTKSKRLSKYQADYVSFIKKALLLCQNFPYLRRVELCMKPAPDHDDSYEDSGFIEEEFLTRQTSTFTTCSVSSHSRYSPLDTLDNSFFENVSTLEVEEELNSLIQNFITVETPAVYDYQYMPEVPVATKRWLTFKVKARSDAHVALSAVYGDTERKTYEIVIGGKDNTTSYVRDGAHGKIMEQVQTVNILDPHDSKSFWISWHNHLIEVGVGNVRGENRFLRCRVPTSRQHGVNCMSVSTGPNSAGQWEFIEYIAKDPQPETECERKGARKSRIQLALLWAAKKSRMLEALEEAFPNCLDTATLLKAANVRMSNMMKAVVFLKDLQNRKLITEVTRGIWMRAPLSGGNIKHAVHVVSELPRLASQEVPTVAVITALYAEKTAVDAMMEGKVSYIRLQQGENMHSESEVYTLGKLGNHHVVSVKLPHRSSANSTTHSASSITRLLEQFPSLEHLVLCGVGGAVPNFADAHKHVRLGDIVVSTPHKKGGPIYLHCDKVQPKGNDTYDFDTRSWHCLNDALPRIIDQMWHLQTSTSIRTLPWHRYIEQGLEILQAEESSFHRPPPKTDKLFALVDGKVVEVYHPTPEGGRRFESEPEVRYGPVGSGKYVARNIKLRLDLSAVTGVVAYDGEFDAVMEAIDENHMESFVIIRGMSDYEDGQKNKDWIPYASLAAAGFMKALVMALPPNRKSSLYR